MRVFRSPLNTVIFAFTLSLGLFGTCVPTWAIDASNPGAFNHNLGASKAPSPESGSAPVSTDALINLETKIVEAFTAGDCARISATANPGLYPRFRPLVLAVVATCLPDHKTSESLFKEAEAKSPYDELILVLHARSLFKIDPEASNKIWGRLFVIAHSPALKKIAQDYLQGTETEGETAALNKSWTFVGSWETSGSHEDNPTGQSASIGSRPSSYGFNSLLYGGVNRTLESGNSIGANFTVTNNVYFSTHYADFWENDIDLPYSVRVGTNEDLIFRPLARYSQYADKTFEAMGGFALTGVAYRETYKQWVQTAIYQNHYYLDVVQPESGTNFHFEYNWEFYPQVWFFRLMAYIQHVSAEEETTITPGADVPYTHNDVGASLFFDYRYKSMTFSFYPSFSVRADDNVSIYQDNSGNIVNKQRADQSVDLRLRAAIAINRSLEAFTYYDWTRTYSNIGFNDYLDRNYTDQTFGVGLRTFVTNY